jgi:protein-S-isoprenylcysteine O-methyltransferase Ste14
MNDDGEASSRFPWPPAIYGLAFVAAAILAWVVPLPFLPDAAALPGRVAGVVMIIAAVALAVLAEQQFRRARTPALPTLPTRAIVKDGVYAYTRNPMYLAMSAGLGAVALAANSLWFILALPFAIYAVTKLAIEREEHYLSRKFGEDYRAYQARVPRWLGPL